MIAPSPIFQRFMAAPGNPLARKTKKKKPRLLSRHTVPIDPRHQPSRHHSPRPFSLLTPVLLNFDFRDLYEPNALAQVIIRSKPKW